MQSISTRKDTKLGHIVGYTVQRTNKNKDDILNEIAENAYREGDGYDTSQMHWHDDIVYQSKKEAMDAISLLDQGFYDDHAVLFKHYEGLDTTSMPKPNKTEQAANENVTNKIKALNAYIEKHHVSDYKSKLVTCPNCGSKIATDWLDPNKHNITHSERDNCPVCHSSLQAESTLAHIQKLSENVDKAKIKAHQLQQRRIDRWQKSMEKQVETCWLIKYEYHV